MQLRSHDLTEIERREVTLFRLIGRWDEAQANNDAAVMLTIEASFLRRLRNYEAACRCE